MISPILTSHYTYCIRLRGKRGKGPRYFDSPLLSSLDAEREGASGGAATPQLRMANPSSRRAAAALRLASLTELKVTLRLNLAWITKADGGP